MGVGDVEEIVQNFKWVNEDGWDADRFCSKMDVSARFLQRKRMGFLP